MLSEPDESMDDESHGASFYHTQFWITGLLSAIAGAKRCYLTFFYDDAESRVSTHYVLTYRSGLGNRGQYFCAATPNDAWTSVVLLVDLIDSVTSERNPESEECTRSNIEATRMRVKQLFPGVTLD